jgi:hypothetical protein
MGNESSRRTVLRLDEFKFGRGRDQTVFTFWDLPGAIACGFLYVKRLRTAIFKRYSK